MGSSLPHLTVVWRPFLQDLSEETRGLCSHLNSPPIRGSFGVLGRSHQLFTLECVLVHAHTHLVRVVTVTQRKQFWAHVRGIGSEGVASERLEGFAPCSKRAQFRTCPPQNPHRGEVYLQPPVWLRNQVCDNLAELGLVTVCWLIFTKGTPSDLTHGRPSR